MIRTFTKSNEFLWSLQNSLTNAHRKTSIIRTYTNSNTCCWSLRNKTSIIRTFWKLKTRKKSFVIAILLFYAILVLKYLHIGAVLSYQLYTGLADLLRLSDCIFSLKLQQYSWSMDHFSGSRK